VAQKIFIMSGSTGGHVYPALAVAKKLRDLGYEPVWLGTDKGLEAKVVPDADILLEVITISALRGKKITAIWQLPLQMIKAIKQVFKLYKKHQPALTIGFGGYVSGPGGIAALIKRIPLVLHEQNTTPGMTNKYLAKYAKAVCASFPDSFPGRNVVVTGNPVREEILSVKKNFHDRQTMPLNILVLGGSQGAKAINEIVPDAINLIGQPVKIWHQAGIDKYKKTTLLYKEKHITARVVPFIKNISKAYDWADLVIARAGAMTVAELAAVGLPSILIPYPYAVDDHQTTNANYLAHVGGAVIMQQDDLDAQKLATEISTFAENRTYLYDMSEKLTNLGMRNATEDVVKICLENLGQTGKTYTHKKSQYGKN